MMHSIDMAKTHEILARYRPIAPKPALPPQSSAGSACGLDGGASPITSEKLATLHHLPPRVSRSRKRGRAGCACVVSQKRPKTSYVPVLPSPVDVSLPFLASKTAQLGLSVQGPAQGFPVPPLQAGSPFLRKMEKPVGSGADLLTLSLVPFSSPAPSCLGAGPVPKTDPANKDAKETTLDLNSEPEGDLTLALPVTPRVIVPQPVRPVGSSISVGCISEGKVESPLPTNKKPEEVEEEVESEVLPAVVSDSKNRVRLANSAYKEMVGQPECSWLDFMVGSGAGVGTTSRAGSRRINGEVMLDLSGSAVLPTSSNGFSCRVTIEWACNGRRTLVNAPCDVIKLFCDSKDYLFAWRFHTDRLAMQTANRPDHLV